MTESAQIDFGNGIIGRVVPGPGDPVLWIHGYTLDSTIWGDLWALLPAWYHIGVDLPGHGASRDLTQSDTLSDVAREIGDIASKNAVQHLVGISFGSLVALEVASLNPSMFKTVVLGSPSLGSSGPLDRIVQARHQEIRRTYSLLGRTCELTELWLRCPPDLFRGIAAFPDVWCNIHEVVSRHSWNELGIDAMYRLTQFSALPSRLKAIDARCLLVIGENDLDVFKRCGEIIKRSLNSCERKYLPALGHLALIESPLATWRILEEHFACA